MTDGKTFYQKKQEFMWTWKDCTIILAKLKPLAMDDEYSPKSDGWEMEMDRALGLYIECLRRLRICVKGLRNCSSSSVASKFVLNANEAIELYSSLIDKHYTFFSLYLSKDYRKLMHDLDQLLRVLTKSMDRVAGDWIREEERGVTDLICPEEPLPETLA